MRIIVNIKNNVITALLFLGMFLFIPLSLSCFEDDMGNVISDENEFIDDLLNSPVPGNMGVITNGGVSNTSIQIIWTKATDNNTPQGDLQYYAVRSNSNNIGTVADALANGTLVQDWTTDISSANATGLNSGTTYYFNVIVRDGDGHMSVYATVSIATSGLVVFIFSSGAKQGDLIGRDNVDSMCSATRDTEYSDLVCNEVRGFISISGDDSIANMPYRYGIPTNAEIRGPTGILIADTWDDMFDHEMDRLHSSLADAGVSGGDWWSFSNADGSYIVDDETDEDNLYTCSSLTSNSDDVLGWGGDSHQVTYEWLTNTVDEDKQACSERLHLLCACWTAVTY